MKHTPSPTTTSMSPAHPAPSVRELDAAWPAVKLRFDVARQRVMNTARRQAESPCEWNLRDLQAAVVEFDAAEAAELDWHQAMGAALRRESPTWVPEPDRRATWEVTS